jgi:ABC-type uncharacterized transport system permease subunit
MLRCSTSANGTRIMKLLKKLYNPFVLVAQGFAVGAALFIAAHPETGDSITAHFAGKLGGEAVASAQGRPI